MPATPVVPGREEPLVRDWVIFSILAREWPQVKRDLEQRLTLR
jgi:hypothetical protein